MKSFRWATLLWVPLTLFLISCASDEPPLPPPADIDPPYIAPNVESIYEETLIEAARLLKEEYIYSDRLDVDPGQIANRFEADIDPETSPTDFDEILEGFVDSIEIDGLSIVKRQDRIERVQSFPPFSDPGIGVDVRFRDGDEPRLIVLDVTPDSPADQAGLAVRDVILAIDGTMIAVEGDSRQLTGESGSEVTLNVRSPGEASRTLTLAREASGTNSPDLSWTILPDTGVIYVIFSSREPANIDQRFISMLQEAFSSIEVEGLILDMRTANTGQFSALGNILPIFVDGEVGYNVSRTDRTPINIQGTLDILRDPSTLPMAVLVGPETRGVPELVAGILQDTGRAYLIGANTPGDIEGVRRFYLPSGTQLSVPISSIVTAQQGRDIGLEGIEPDLEIDILIDEVPFATDPIIAGALEFIELANFSNDQNEG